MCFGVLNFDFDWFVWDVCEWDFDWGEVVLF